MSVDPVFIQMFFIDGSNKEQLLITVPLHVKTTGEDIFKNFYASNFIYIKVSRLFAHFLEMNIPTHKPVSVTTDGALAMTSEHLGLIGLAKNSPLSHLTLCHSSARAAYKSDQF
jgi:hypothetical protein